MAKRKAFMLRIEPELYESLRRWAEADLRSVNGQIEYLLRRAVRDAGRGRGDDDASPGDAPDRAGPDDD